MKRIKSSTKPASSHRAQRITTCSATAARSSGSTSLSPTAAPTSGMAERRSSATAWSPALRPLVSSRQVFPVRTRLHRLWRLAVGAYARRSAGRRIFTRCESARQSSASMTRAGREIQEEVESLAGYADIFTRNDAGLRGALLPAAVGDPRTVRRRLVALATAIRRRLRPGR